MAEPKVLYARVSAGRREEFRIRTRILEDADGSRRVEKTAVSPEAEAHLERIAEVSRRLSELYAGSGIEVNRCAFAEDAGSSGGSVLELEYLEGDTMEFRLDQMLLAEGPEAVETAMRALLAELIPEEKLLPIDEAGTVERESLPAGGAGTTEGNPLSRKEGRLAGGEDTVDEYHTIFGKHVLPLSGAKTLPVTDIDMVPANVILTDTGKMLLDCEWTFLFPIPVDFVRYRILHYYYEGQTIRKGLLPDDWYARFGLNEDQVILCKRMEESFQSYIRGGATTENDIEETVEEEGTWSKTEYYPVHLLGEALLGRNDRLFLPFRQGSGRTRIRLPEATEGFRLEMRDRPCLCRVERLQVGDRSLIPYIETGGVLLEENLIAFPEAAPYIRVVLPHHAGDQLEIAITIEDGNAVDVRERIRENEEKKNAGNIAGAATHAIAGVTENVKGAGFAGYLRRAVKNRLPGKKLLYHLDRGNQTDTRTILRGWAFDPDGEVDIVLTDKNGRELPAEIRRIRRADVEETMGTVQAAFSGFYICMQNRDLPKDGLVLLFEAGKRRRAYLLDPATDPAFSEEAGAAQPADWMDYMEWFLAHRVTEEGLVAQRKETFPRMPKISIVIPLYNTPVRYLRELLVTITEQSYANWELCLADGSPDDAVEEEIRANWLSDPRILYQRLAENTGISGNTNEALAMATGDYIVFSDHDDLLEKDALYEIVRAINEDPQPDIVYTDEDLVDETGNEFYSPRFKCGFDHDLLCSINYICHLFVVKREIFEKVGLLDPEKDGAQDWDFILRCSEHTGRIVRVPRILYHWRAAESSTAGNPDSKTYAIRAGENAVTAHLQRLGIEAELEYSGIFILFRPLPKVVGEPKVSIIICNKDQSAMLKTCVDSILQKSTYPNYEIIVVENNSEEEKTFAFYREYEEKYSQFRVVRFEGAFNYSEVNNFGAAHAEGEYLLLLNNDTEVITPEWLERMVGYCQQNDVAAVGAKLYYEDHTVQHCGVVIGMGGFAGHVHTREPAYKAGHLGRLQAVMDVSAVTAACMMVKRTAFEEVGGLDPAFKVALNDIDFCLRLREKGYLIVCHPGVELFHYESMTRGYEETQEKKERFLQEIRRFRERWAEVLEEGDPYYSPHLSLIYGDSRLREENEVFDLVEEIRKKDAGDEGAGSSEESPEDKQSTE